LVSASSSSVSTLPFVYSYDGCWKPLLHESINSPSLSNCCLCPSFLLIINGFSQIRSMVCSLGSSRIFLEVYLYSLFLHSLLLFVLSLCLSYLCVVLHFVCCLFCFFCLFCLFCLFCSSCCCLFGDFSSLLGSCHFCKLIVVASCGGCVGLVTCSGKRKCARC
jgi:hypothetical protein